MKKGGTNSMFRKGLAFVIVVLFIGVSVVSGIKIQSKNRTITNTSVYENILNVGSSSGLVAYWSFDEGSGNIAYDSSGNNINGNIEGANWTTGINGSALNYDGIDDYVEINSLTYDINDDQIGTISAWIYRTSQSENCLLPQIFCMDNNTDDDTSFNFGIIQENNKDYIYIKLRDDQRNVCFYKMATFSLDFYRWHHIAAVQNGIGIKIYVDGIERNLIDIESGDSSGDWFADLGINKPNLAQFGSHYEVDNPYPVYNYTSFFNGIIDEVRIYNYNLTQNEIISLYEQYANKSIAIIFGTITNLTAQGDYIQFEAVKTRVITIYPLSFNTYLSGEKFSVTKDYKGLIGVRYIFAFCKMLV